MAKSKKSAASWAKDRGLVGILAYFTTEERRAIRLKAAQAEVSVREFVRQSALMTKPEQVRKKDSDSC